MPIGCLSIVPDVMVEVLRGPRRRILDLGIGMGFYGAAIRQWCDMGFVEQFETHITGVEAFDRYHNPAWNLYNVVIHSTIEEFLFPKNLALTFSPTKFDVILLLDVLEHFDCDRGVEVLTKAKTMLLDGGRFIVATPGIFCEQGAVYGNSAEIHRSLWTKEDLEANRFRILCDGVTPDAWGNQMLVGVYTHNPT